MKKRSIRLNEKFYKKTLPMVIALLVAVATFIALFIIYDWNNCAYVEENFIALEEIAKNIEETKNFTLPLSNNLTSYDVTVYSNGKVLITLTGPQTQTCNITASYDENYNLLSVERSCKSAIVPTLNIILMILLVSLLIALLTYMSFRLIIYFILSVSEKIKNKKIKKKFKEPDTFKSDFEF